jgi:hypothetical protein
MHEKTPGQMHNKHFAQQESTLPISGIRQGLTEVIFSPHSTSTAQNQ